MTTNATPKPPTNRGDRAPITHRACTHADNKAERAKCRKALYAMRAELQAEKKS